MRKDSQVIFVILNVPGSNNDGLPWTAPFTDEAVRTQEIAQRSAANLRWLERAFAWASQESARGVVLGLQADMLDPAAIAPAAMGSMVSAGLHQQAEGVAPADHRPTYAGAVPLAERDLLRRHDLTQVICLPPAHISGGGNSSGMCHRMCRYLHKGVASALFSMHSVGQLDGRAWDGRSHLMPDAVNDPHSRGTEPSAESPVSRTQVRMTTGSRCPECQSEDIEATDALRLESGTQAWTCRACALAFQRIFPRGHRVSRSREGGSADVRRIAPS